MSISSNLRQLYKPVQPTVRQSAEKVSYREFLPEPDLQPYIYCYWQLHTVAPLAESFSYRVVADGCMDIFFELHDPEKNFVMGFCKKYTAFSLGNSFHYIGIRFLPTMFPQLFGVDASEVSNRFERLDLVVPEVSGFISQHLHANLETGEIKNIFDSFFLQRIANLNFNADARLYGAIDIILQKFGMVDIETDLDTGISPRQLRRLFKYYIGDTAKTFSKVVRFQNILKAKPSGQSLRQNKLFFDAGYYDQAHFIKEFKNFYGVTPGKAFGR